MHATNFVCLFVFFFALIQYGISYVLLLDSSLIYSHLLIIIFWNKFFQRVTNHNITTSIQQTAGIASFRQ